MGKLGGKMKNQFNKISEKIPGTKKSANEMDEFDKVVLGIGQEVKSSQDKDKEDGRVQEQHQEQQFQELELADSPDQEENPRLSKVVQKMTDVKGKLNKLGRAAKTRLSTLQPNSSFNHEENDSAHSSASKDSNNSLTATARLSRSLPVLFPTTAATPSTSSASLESLPSVPPQRIANASASATEPSSSTVVAEEDFLEMWSDETERENGNGDGDTGKPFNRLSRRPSEYLEFEKCSGPEESSAGASGGEDMVATAAPVSTVSHTPFLYPKVKKLNFLKPPSFPSSSSSTTTPPLETSDLALEEPDPYYQPYAHHSHPASLSEFFFVLMILLSLSLSLSLMLFFVSGGAKHWVEKKILNKRSVHHTHSDQQNIEDFFLQTEKVEDDNCV
jgi:hypothetical protein